MPWAEDTIRATVRGAINNVQSWSTGFWFATANFQEGATYGQAQLDGLRDSGDLQGFWTALFGALESYFSSAVSITEVEYSLYQPAQRGAVATSVWSLPTIFEGTTNPHMPAECAMVVSVSNGVPGPSGRGRIYWPLLGDQLNQTTLGVPNTTAQNFANSTGTFLSAVAAHPFDNEVLPTASYNLVPSLASYKHGTNHALTKLSCDTRIDAQRRRENKLPSTRIFSSTFP